MSPVRSLLICRLPGNPTVPALSGPPSFSFSPYLPLTPCRCVSGASLKTTMHSTVTRRLTPFPRPPKPDTPPIPQSTRPTRPHEKRVFTPHSPLPNASVARAPPGTKRFDPEKPPPYQVARTPSLNLPVYLDKIGTTMQRLDIRKIRGNRRALVHDLVKDFGFDPNKVLARTKSEAVSVMGANYEVKESVLAWLVKKGF